MAGIGDVGMATGRKAGDGNSAQAQSAAPLGEALDIRNGHPADISIDQSLRCGEVTMPHNASLRIARTG